MGIVGRKRGFLALLLPICFAIMLGRFPTVLGLNYTEYRQVSSLRLERIKTHLDQINKPAVMTIESPDGDIIDCVHKRKQPALDHPLLKNHKIQRHPQEMPKARMMKEDGARDEKSNEVVKGAWQMWHQNGTRCPRGTVPIRRSTMNDVLRAKSLFDFGKKQRRVSLTRRTDAPDVVSGNGHETFCGNTISQLERGD